MMFPSTVPTSLSGKEESVGSEDPTSQIMKRASAATRCHPVHGFDTPPQSPLPPIPPCPLRATPKNCTKLQLSCFIPRFQVFPERRISLQLSRNLEPKNRNYAMKFGRPPGATLP